MIKTDFFTALQKIWRTLNQDLFKMIKKVFFFVIQTLTGSGSAAVTAFKSYLINSKSF